MRNGYTNSRDHVMYTHICVQETGVVKEICLK